MTSNTVQTQPTEVVHAIVNAAIEPNNYELIRNVGRVLGITSGQHVLLLSSESALQQVLSDTFNCDVTLFNGDMRQMPYGEDAFDSVIVARPITTALLPIARELARVVKLNGTLGMVVLSLHADFVTEANVGADQLNIFGSMLRPAAAYRAVLAESGFTAFVSTPRREDLLRSVRDTYRQHLLQPTTTGSQPASDVPTQVMNLLATEGVAITLITAEKAL